MDEENKNISKFAVLIARVSRIPSKRKSLQL